jgi:DNA-binding FadR family transcriptional regulator
MERYEQTLTDLRKMINTGGINGDGRLPPERDLARILGVGRRVLRGALGVLEREGEVSRRQGRGTFVTARGNGTVGPLSGIFRHTNPLEVMEVRLTVEPTIARLAALRASRCDIERLRLLVEETRTARDSVTYRNADAAFHRGIAEAARNALFLAFYDSLQAFRHDESWERLGENGRCYKRQAVYAKDHREIFEAIATRDSERAQAAMYRHLSDVQRLLAEHVFPDVSSRPAHIAAAG